MPVKAIGHSQPTPSPALVAISFWSFIDCRENGLKNKAKCIG
jgi:hypothetical protein